MDVEIEKKDDRLILKVEKNHTLFNLIRKALWEVGAEAGYDKGHPYIGKATLVVKDKNPEKKLKEAIIKVKNDLKEFRAEFGNCLKK